MNAVLLLPLFTLIPLLPVAPASTSGDWQILVPRLPDGYGPGRVAVRVRTSAVPPASAGALMDGLALRTGVAATAAHGVRIEVVLPDDVEFLGLDARVADGLVLAPEHRGVVRRIGDALLSVVRLLFFGRLVAAADDLALSGVAWASALGAPQGGDEMVRLTTADTFEVRRGHRSFSDHGDFVVCRAMFALTPWTELVQVRLRGLDRSSGREVEFRVPRIPLDGVVEPEAPLPFARTAVAWSD